MSQSISLLPHHFQGHFHKIQMPLQPGMYPSAYICYLRPRQFDGESEYDIIDDKILESINQKFP